MPTLQTDNGDIDERDAAFRDVDRPEIALVTNHGYAGADIPVGGAPDTGGQNLYVNTLAHKLDRLGYKVTIFTRGGFPFFGSQQRRAGTEFLGDHIRYVFIPGGGPEFIRKEDIAVALDEELDWLGGYCNREAAVRGIEPWELFEFINSHYWDAAVLAVRLLERWRNAIVETSMRRLLHGVVSDDVLQAMERGRHWRAMGEVPGFHLGRLLMHHVSMRQSPVDKQVRAAASLWCSAKVLDASEENRLVDRVVASLRREDTGLDPTLERLIAAASLGREVLAMSPEFDEQLKRALAHVDRHVWTPHSLGELKDYNYRDVSPDVRRSLKFCERRSHERMVCSRTHAFAATSAKIAERLWTHYRVPVEDTFYFPPCVDREVFRPRESKELRPTYRWLADRLGVDPERLEASTIVFETSRMDATKRKDLIVSAFARLRSSFPDALLLIGGGPKNEIHRALEDQLAADEGLAEQAFLLEAIPEEHIGPMFSVADIYATASEMEGFGMSVSQAASAGAPVVSTDTIPFSIHHAAGAALLFAPGDVEGLTGGLRRLLDDAGERRQRGRAMERSLDGLDWLARTRSFLEYLVARGFEIHPGRPSG